MALLFLLWFMAAFVSVSVVAWLPPSRSCSHHHHHHFALTRSPVKKPVSSKTTTRLYSGGDIRVARQYIGEGMQAFRQGNVKKSIELFDRAESEEPKLDPFLWQRGLSYYYADEFEKASKQFRRDVKVNPLDVEEIVWDIASQLRMAPSDFPVPSALALPPNQSDRRPIMAVVHKLFRGTAQEEELAKAGHNTGKPSDEFYSLLYLGLFAEGRQNPTKAEYYLRQAVHTEYATRLGRSDYMTDVAKIHCRLRGWES